MAIRGGRFTKAITAAAILAVMNASSTEPPEIHAAGIDTVSETDSDSDTEIHEPRLWRADRWTARVIKNEDDDGWAVSMTRDGEAEPALVGPWTMGRDKKNPKPLDTSAFSTLVKTASEVLRRHEQQLHAQLHKSVTIDSAAGRITVMLDIDPDEDSPSAQLSAVDVYGTELGRSQASPGFRLNVQTAQTWVDGGFVRPAASRRGEG
jgi:hypothetical protein